MKKRIISIFLCLMLLMTIAPLGAFATGTNVPAIENVVWNGDDGLTCTAVNGAVYYTLELWSSSGTRCWSQVTFLPNSSGYTISGNKVIFTSNTMKSIHRNLTADGSCYMVVSAENSSHTTIASTKTDSHYLKAYPAMEQPQNVKWSGAYATWDAVSGVSSYTLWLYEVESNGTINPKHIYTTTTDAKRVSLGAYLEGGKTYRFMVQSNAPDITHRNSSSAKSGDVIAIDKIEAIGLTAPEIGKLASENAKSIKAPAGANYTLSSAGWLDKSNNSATLASNAKFEAGHEYALRVYATPKAGYVFVSTSKMTGTVDGKAGTVGGVYNSDNQYAMRYDFGAPNNATITSVDVSGYALPVAGAKAGDYMNLSVSENCHLDMSKCYWYCKSTGKTLAADDVFEAGKQYALTIYVCADTNCRFSGDAAVTINGSTEYVDTEHIGLGNIVIPFWTKPVTVASAISSVNVSGYEPAVVGAKAGDRMDLYAYGNYNIDWDSCYWFCDTTGTRLKSTDVFEAGKEYSLYIVLIPDGANTFADDVSYTVNGSTEYVDYRYSQNTAGCVELWTTSMEPKAAVGPVEISGYEPAVVGDKAGDHMGFAVNSDCCIDWESSYWYCDTTGETLAANDVFEAGNEYSLLIYLIPDSGYAFAYDVDCTVNGSTAYVDYDCCQRTFDSLEVWTVPTEALEEITSVEISGYDPAVVGDIAGNHMDLFVSGDCTISYDDCYWYCDTTCTALNSNDVFEADKEYSLFIYLIPDSGYVFADDTYIILNGATEYVDFDNCQSIPDSLEVWTVPMKPMKAVTTVAISGYEPAVVGDKAGNHMNLSVNDSCTVNYDECYWYCDTTHQELSANDVFEAGKEYSLLISIIPKAGYVFTYDSTVTVNGGTACVDFDSSSASYCWLDLWTIPTEAKSVTPVTPAAPTLSLSKADGKINLSWNAVSGATKYWIYRSTDGTNYKYYDTTTKTSYTNSSVTSGTKYYYKVKAVNNCGGKDYISGYSNAKSTIPLTTPTVKASLSTGAISLSWGSVTGATKYWIYRSTDGVNFKYYDSTTKTSYTNSSVTAGTTYYYEVRAVKTVNGTDWTSDYSAAASVSVLNAPTVSISKADGKISLNWTAVDGAAKYWIYRSTDGTNYKYYDTTTKTSYTNSSVTSGTKYYYKVKAVNVDGGSSAYSAAKSTIPLSTPTVSAALNNGKVNLSWNSVTGATKYWIYRSTDGVNFKYYDSTTKTTYTNSSVTAGTTYYYEIRAVKTVNGTDWTGSYSAPVSITR